MNMNQSQVPFGVPETGNQKKPGKGLLIACVSVFAVLGVIAGLFLGRSFGASNAKSSEPALHPTADAGESKRDQSGKYIDPEESEFSWNIDDLADLEFGTYESPDLGTSIEDVVDVHGKALKGTFRKERIDLEWGELEEEQDGDDTLAFYRTVRGMRLTFQKKGDNFYLKDLYYSGNYKEAEEDFMTSSYYDKLKVGDAKTGKDGVSYKEVIKDHTIYSLSMSAEEDYKTNDIVTTMTVYIKSSSSSEYRFTFVRQSDGDFLLSEKE